MQQDFPPDKAQLIEEGDNHFKGFRYEEALAAYERAIELDPRDAALYYLKGNALGRLGEKKLALAAYERATELDPAYAAAYFEQGKLFRRLGWSRKELAASEQALRLDPENIAILYHTGAALSGAKRYIETLAIYERIIALDPAQERASVRRAIVIGHLQGIKAMLAAFDAEIARAADPSFFLTQKAEALHEIYSVLPPEQQAEQQETILAIYNQILQQYPVDVYTAAKNKAQFKRDPRDSVFAHKGTLLFSLKRYEEAMEAFEGYVLCGCCFDCVWYGLHKWVLSIPDFPAEAWTAYNRLIQRSENPIGIYSMLGDRLDQIKRHGEALAIHELVIAMCDQAIHERPTSFAYRMKGCSLRAIGRLDEAEAANQMSHALRKAGQLL